MKNKITDKIMKDLLDVDFYYEATCLRECLNYIKINIRGDKVPDFILVSFLIHLRNLYEFFYGSPNNSRYAHAGNYNPNWIKIEAPKGFEFGEWYNKLSTFLVHLSYKRRTLSHKKYPIFGFYPHFRELIIKFLRELDPKYNTNKLKFLLRELEQEVKKGKSP